jgi:hypothetical protein
MKLTILMFTQKRHLYNIPIFTSDCWNHSDSTSTNDSTRLSECFTASSSI